MKRNGIGIPGNKSKHNFERLNIKAEVHDVAVFHDIVLALNINLAGFAYCRFRTVGQIVFILDDFGTDKAFLKVCMDDAGALGCFPALTER